MARCMPLCDLRAALLWGRPGQSLRTAAVCACLLLPPLAVDSGSGPGVPVAEHTLGRDRCFRGLSAGGCGHGLAFLLPWRVVRWPSRAGMGFCRDAFGPPHCFLHGRGRPSDRGGDRPDLAGMGREVLAGVDPANVMAVVGG